MNKKEKLASKIEEYNKLAAKFNFGKIQYKNYILSAFKPNTEDSSDGFFSSLKSIIIYTYMGWKYDGVLKAVNKSL